MGELVVAFLFAVLVIGGAGWAVTAVSRRRSIGHRPAPMLGVHDEAALADRAASLYRLSQRAVRLLERLDADLSVAGMMSHEDRAEARAIVKDFYDA